jgi:hypothetical protein
MTGVMGYATDRAVIASIRGHHRATNAQESQNPDVGEVFEALRPVLDAVLRRLRSRYEFLCLGSPAKVTGGIESTRRVGGKSGRLNRVAYGYRETDTESVRAEWPQVAVDLMSDRIAYPIDLPPDPKRQDGQNLEVPRFSLLGSYLLDGRGRCRGG